MVDYNKLKEKLKRMPDQRAQSQARGKVFKEKKSELEFIEEITSDDELSTNIYQRPVDFNGEDAKTQPIKSPLHSKEETAKEEVTASQPQSMVGVSEQTQKGHEAQPGKKEDEGLKGSEDLPVPPKSIYDKAQPAEPPGKTQEMKSLSREELEEPSSGEKVTGISAREEESPAEDSLAKKLKTYATKVLSLSKLATDNDVIDGMYNRFERFGFTKEEIKMLLEKVSSSKELVRELLPLIHEKVEKKEAQGLGTLMCKTGIRKAPLATVKEEEEAIPPGPTLQHQAPSISKPPLLPAQIADELDRGAGYKDLKDEQNLRAGVVEFKDRWEKKKNIDVAEGILIGKGFPEDFVDSIIMVPRPSKPPAARESKPATTSDSGRHVLSEQDIESTSRKSEVPPPPLPGAKPGQQVRAPSNEFILNPNIEIPGISGGDAASQEHSVVPLSGEKHKVPTSPPPLQSSSVAVPQKEMKMTSDDVARLSVAPTVAAGLEAAQPQVRELDLGSIKDPVLREVIKQMRELRDQCKSPKEIIKQINKDAKKYKIEKKVKEAQNSVLFKEEFLKIEKKWPLVEAAKKKVVELIKKSVYDENELKANLKIYETLGVDLNIILQSEEVRSELKKRAVKLGMEIAKKNPDKTHVEKELRKKKCSETLIFNVVQSKELQKLLPKKEVAANGVQQDQMPRAPWSSRAKKLLAWILVGSLLGGAGAVGGVYLAMHPKQVDGWFKGLKSVTKQLSVGKSKQPDKGTKETTPKGEKKYYEKYLQELDEELKSISR